MSKKLFIRTYGCQMNAYDSVRMADALAAQGYVLADGPETADLVILNTCHIREKAAEKVYSELGRLRLIKDGRRAGGRPPMMIGVAGCVAQAEGDALLERAPFVDLVVGPQTYHRLPELVERRRRGEAGVIDTDFPVESKFDHLPSEGAAPGVSAFLTVQEGCDKFCTFCVVPYTRGAEASRPPAAVLAEARRLVTGGAREITLLGQNVNAYHGTGPDGRSWSLARLIRELAAIDGLWRLRYTTSHPADVSDDLIAAHRDVPALMPYLHLPIQSGSDRVLEAMNRRHRVADYLRIVDRLRSSRPDLALSSDLIVGFPGETDEDFAATLDVVDRVGFVHAFSFKYSRRPGTPAALLGRQVPERVKRERLAELQRRLDDHTGRFNRATVGTRLPVLLEREGRRAGQKVGRTPYLQAVHLDAPDLALGTMVPVEIVACHAHSLAGVRVAEPRHEEMEAVA